MVSRHNPRPADAAIDIPAEDALEQAAPVYPSGDDPLEDGDLQPAGDAVEVVKRRPIDAPEADALEQAEDLSAWDDEDGGER